MYGELGGHLGRHWEIRECPSDVRGDTRMFRQIWGNTEMSGDVQGENGVFREILGNTGMSKGCTGTCENVLGDIGKYRDVQGISKGCTGR